ncbi:uncharacterized protein [Apostichopus japonicus]|uniref:uncharacterized protein n=1 Tax=Stichopus japonicus TaxID=307972 RepID=UPI003AB50799
MTEANRPRRSKREVSYTTFDVNDDSDEDFASFTPPASKKTKKEKRDVKSSKRQPDKQKSKETGKKTPKERKAVDDRIFDKELELALEISKVETGSQEQQESKEIQASRVTGDVKEESIRCEKVVADIHIPEERDAVDVTEALADRNTCEVLPTKNSKVTDSEDEIKLIETVPAGSEINHNNGRSKRRAATTAAKKQRQVLEDSDEDGEFEETAQGDSDDEFKADDASDGSNDDDAEDEDFSFSPKKKRRKGSEEKAPKKVNNQKKTVGGKHSKTPRKEKKATGDKQLKTSKTANENTAPTTLTRKTPLMMRGKSKGFSSPLTTNNSTSKSPNLPAVRQIKRKAVVTSPQDSSGSNPLGGVRLVSPGQPFRLGLSRFARVKPLHDAT